MGICGASSLLLDDRHRFGIPWSIEKRNDKINVLIYIDGPALLYHLIHPNSNITPSSSIDHESTTETEAFAPFGIVSPENLYLRGYQFVSNLIKAGANEIHLVMEGIAPRSKLNSQLERLKQNRIYCDRCMKELSNETQWKIPHLFADVTLIRIFEDVNDEYTKTNGSKDDKVFIHYANGEAENYIAYMLSNRNNETKHRHRIDDQNPIPQSNDSILILSNDSDFLVYQSCPGYVPLHTIQFTYNHETNDTHTDQSVVVTGWHFLRKKFLTMDIKTSQMPYVAALAGCDYESNDTELKKSLSIARQRILHSPISNLRTKNRNKPTAKIMLIAIIRIISHCNQILDKTNKHDSNVHTKTKSLENEFFLTILINTIMGNDTHPKHQNNKEQLLQILNEISSSYNSNHISEGNCYIPKKGNMLVWNLVIRKIIHHHDFLCKAVIEVYFHNKSNKKKKNIQPSVWLDSYFIQLRMRMYSVILSSISSSSFSSSSSSSKPELPSSINIIVKEYSSESIHSRNINLYQGISSTFPYDIVSSIHTVHKHNHNVFSNISLLNYCLGFHDEIQSNAFNDKMKFTLLSMDTKWLPVFVSAIILSKINVWNNCDSIQKNKDRNTSDYLFFVFVSTFPNKWKIHKDSKFNTFYDASTLTRKPLMLMMTRIQVACYHGWILLSMFFCSTNNNRNYLPWHVIFRDEVSIFCYHIYRNSNECIDEAYQSFHSLWNNLKKAKMQNIQGTFTSLQLSLASIIQEMVRKVLPSKELNENDIENIQDWSHSLSMMWNILSEIL